MSDQYLTRLKTKVLEVVEEPEDLSAAQKFFKSYPPEKKAVLLSDILGIEEVDGWSREEIESYFNRNADDIIDQAVEDEEIRKFLEVDRDALMKIASNDGELTIDELIDDDGTLVGSGKGSKRPKHNTDSEIRTAPQQTTADYSKGVTQPRRYYMYGGTPYSHGAAGGAMESNEKEGFFIRERKIKKVVEDLLDKKFKNDDGDDDIVKNKNPSDINKNKIEDVGELFRRQGKAAVATNTNKLIDSIKNNELEGEELAMVLNSIIENVNTNEIPNELKKEIVNKI